MFPILDESLGNIHPRFAAGLLTRNLGGLSQSNHY